MPEPTSLRARDEMLGLAEQLFDEIDRGRVPVWPTTTAYATRLVLGLRTMRMQHPDRVAAIVAAAPAGTPLDWRKILEAI